MVATQSRWVKRNRNQPKYPTVTRLWGHLVAGWKFRPALLAFPLTAHHASTHLYISAHNIHQPAGSAHCYPLLWAPSPSYGWATLDGQPLMQLRGLPAWSSWLAKAKPWGAKEAKSLTDYRGLRDMKIVFPGLCSDRPKSRTSYIVGGARCKMKTWSLLFQM